MKILVIDDSRFQINHTVKVLKGAGFEAVTAKNGSEGLEVLAQEQPEAIICDLIMPVMDGFALLQELKERSIETPVIIVSSNTQKMAQERCDNLGAKLFLNKPLSEESVLELIKPLLEKKRDSA